jgi:hypothetical protein
VTANVLGQDFLDKVQDDLNLKTRDGFFQANLSMLLDLEGYYVDQRPPALLYPDHSFFNPRATFFVDTTLGNHFYGFLRARVDRGFDPGESPNAEARLEEYLLRWMPLDRSLLNLQFGKFATVVGSWVRRHDSWQNPLIDAPLPYNNLTIVSDGYPPASPAAFLARKNLPDNKDEWLPVIWEPVYATGWAVFGSVEKFDYAIELKNVALSARPERWDLDENLWHYPTVSGRIGFRPSPAWDHGISFSIGPYLSNEAQDSLPPGKGIGDFNQITLDYDVSYAWRRWQFWAEMFLTRFDVPNVGNADVLTYYIEAKYKITSGLYAAARWNQQLFGKIDNGAGGQEPWDNDMLRVDVALGYRFTRHLQSKIQYSYGHRDSSLQQGEQLVAVQVTLNL